MPTPKPVTLQQVKEAIRSIANKRLEGVTNATIRTDVLTSLTQMDGKTDAALAWQEAKALLGKIPPGIAVVCCASMIGSTTFKLTMTNAECAEIPGSVFTDGPCLDKSYPN